MDHPVLKDDIERCYQLPRLSGRSEAVSDALSLWLSWRLPPPPPCRAARLAKPLVSTRFSRA